MNVYSAKTAGFRNLYIYVWKGREQISAIICAPLVTS